jgi:hypothetical protein
MKDKTLNISLLILFMYGVSLGLTSCSTAKTCHAKKAYVPKSIVRAQNKPRHY